MRISWPLIDRYYAGDATPDEQRQVAEFLARFPLHARVTETVAATVAAAKPSAPDEQDITRMLEDAQRRLTAPQRALKNLVATYFGGSVRQAVTALLDMEDTELEDEDIMELRELIQQAEEEGR